MHGHAAASRPGARTSLPINLGSVITSPLLIAAQALLGEVEEVTPTETSTRVHHELRKATWQASVRRR